MSRPAITLMREVRASLISSGGVITSWRMPSILKRTRTLSSYGSIWMSLAPRATASFISESTSATTGASSASLRETAPPVESRRRSRISWMTDGRTSTALTWQPVRNRISFTAARSAGSLMATSSAESARRRGTTWCFRIKDAGNSASAASSGSASSGLVSWRPNRSATKSMSRFSSTAPSRTSAVTGFTPVRRCTAAALSRSSRVTTPARTIKSPRDHSIGLLRRKSP